MKKIIFSITLIFMILSFTACDSDVDLPEMTEEEYPPRILGRWPELTDGGELGQFDAQAGQEFELELMFTPPSNLCEEYGTSTE